ncbi:hypothetical protein HYV43_02285 [Candidatus Micrarchaeota archaeon]|nr:hypothetical protein [Candidatus Micrarchaeota archaeon]
MTSFQDAFSEGTIVSLVFVLVLGDFFVGTAGRASDSFWVWSLGSIIAVPMAVLKGLSGVFPLFGPVAALLALGLFVQLKDSLGSGVYAAILIGAVLLGLGV